MGGAWTPNTSVIQRCGNALDDIARDGAPAAVVNKGGSRIGVAQETLHVLKGDILVKEIGGG